MSRGDPKPIRLKKGDWAVIHAALQAERRSERRSADRLAGLKGTAALIRGIRKRQDRLARIVEAIGEDGEIAEYRGIARARGNPREAWNDPARTVLDEVAALFLLRRGYRPPAGAWEEDADPAVAARKFIDDCRREVVKADRFRLDYFARRVLGWEPAEAVPEPAARETSREIG